MAGNYTRQITARARLVSPTPAARLRRASFAYFVFAGVALAGLELDAWLRPEGEADLIEAMAAVLGTLFWVALAMGLRRHERWARWLGARIGLGAALAGIGSLFSSAGSLSAGELDLRELALRAFLIPVLGGLGGYAASQLACRDVREALAERAIERPTRDANVESAR